MAEPTPPWELFKQQEQQQLIFAAPRDEARAPWEQFRALENPTYIQAPQVQTADGLWDSFVAGTQTSVVGLALRQQSPDIILTENAVRAERLSAMVGQVLGDMPTFIVGAIGGGAAGTAVSPGLGTAIGAGAGAFALTDGARTWMMEQYAKGHTKSDVADRLAATAWAAAKGAVVGGATLGVGKGVAGAVSGGAVSQFTKVTAAELATLVTVSKGLEGEIPSLDDFIDAGILLGGLKGSAAAAGKLVEIYKRTGVKPADVVKEASKESQTWREVVDEKFDAIPESLKPLERSPLSPDPRLQDIAANPFREVPAKDATLRSEVNYRTFDQSKEGPLQVMSKIAEKYKAEMQLEQRSPVSWKQSEAEAAALIRDWIGEPGMKSLFEPGTINYTADILARKDLLVRVATDITERATVIEKQGTSATPQQLSELMISIDRARRIQQSFIGKKAELGRGMNILKKATEIEELNARNEALLKALERAGGVEAARQLAQFVAETRSPKDLMAASRKATTFEKVIEMWKAGLVSGIRTHEVNLISTLAFAMTRAPKEVVAAAIGSLRSGEKVQFTDAFALQVGMVMGSIKGIKAAGETIRLNVAEKGYLAGIVKTIKEVKPSPKVEQPRKAIEGAFGDVVRTPFQMLTAGDALLRSMNREAELWAMASRKAGREGLTPMSSAYWNRVKTLVDHPTPKMREKAELAELRYSFLEEGGGFVKGIEKLRGDWPGMHFIVPFIRTPAAIFREFARLTPFAPAVKQWRADIAKGGIARDRAYAEVALGLTFAVPLFLMARDGVITGSLHPDRKVRDAQRAAKMQPYSIRFRDGTYMSVSRLEPLGTLIGLIADLTNAWQFMEGAEQDKAVSVVAFATANILQNKTWLQGLSSLINAMSDPERYASKWVESLAGTLVPGIVGQTAQMMDPYVREVDSILEAVQARIPGLRSKLLIRRDIFGEHIRAAEGLWPSSPITVQQLTTDPVRLEAMRLGVSQAQPPRKVIAGSLAGAPAEIELTADQRDIFAGESGKMAYDIIQQSINSPAWQNLHPLMQRRFLERTFAISRQQAGIKAVPPQDRLQALEALRAEHGL